MLDRAGTSAPDPRGTRFRTLDARKGPAVRATRAQIDRALDRRNICGVLERTPRLALLPQATSGLLSRGPRGAR